MVFSGKFYTSYHFRPLPAGDDLYEPMYFGDDCTLVPPERRLDGYEAMKWWLWKNLDPKQNKWVGLQQYRRAIYWEGRSYAQINDLACEYDIITCAPYARTNMRLQYTLSHGPSTWEALERILGPGWDYESNLIPHGGIGTMRYEIFNDYMAKQDEIFKVFEPDPSDLRRSAFMERFWALYVYRLMSEHPDVRILWLPFVEGRQQHKKVVV